MRSLKLQLRFTLWRRFRPTTQTTGAILPRIQLPYIQSVSVCIGAVILRNARTLCRRKSEQSTRALNIYTASRTRSRRRRRADSDDSTCFCTIRSHRFTMLEANCDCRYILLAAVVGQDLVRSVLSASFGDVDEEHVLGDGLPPEVVQDILEHLSEVLVLDVLSLVLRGLHHALRLVGRRAQPLQCLDGARQALDSACASIPCTCTFLSSSGTTRTASINRSNRLRLSMSNVDWLRKSVAPRNASLSVQISTSTAGGTVSHMPEAQG